MIQLDWTFLFQIMNTLALVFIIYGVYRLVRTFTQKRSETNKRLQRIEEKLDKLNIEDE